MARTVRDSNLETRAARSRLASRHKPYFRTLDAGCHIGYRKGERSGTWRARKFINGRYREHQIGLADDVQDPDGIHVFSFSQAQEAARKWFSLIEHEEAGVQSGPYTFKQAAEDYMSWFRSHRKSVKETQRMIDVNLLPEFGPVELSKLTAKRIGDWMNDLAVRPGRLRNNADKAPLADNDARRKRKATVNRNFNLLKAILNYAYREGKVASDHQWRRVRPFAKVDQPKIQFLQLDECARIVNACVEEFRPMVEAALLTGCRYGELANLHCEDFIADGDAVYIRDSKSGKPRSVSLNTMGVRFFTKVVAGKDVSALMFPRPDGGKWGHAQQYRPMRDACITAKVKHASFHVLRHTYAAHLAMKGVTLQVIAQQLGHSDTRITERHYAHLCPSHVANTIKAKLPEFGIKVGAEVVKITQGKVRKHQQTA